MTVDSISKNVILLSMKRISIELNATLNKKLKKYIHAHYESAFGKQEIVLHDALVEFLNAHGTSQPQVEEIDEVLTPAELGTQQTEPATSHSAESAQQQEMQQEHQLNQRQRESGNHLRPRKHLRQQPKKALLNPIDELARGKA